MRLGFVVPHYLPEGTGNVPEAARELLTRLGARGHRLEVLTTAALDSRTGENVLPAGTTESEGVTLRRFKVSHVCDEEGGAVAPSLPAYLNHNRRDWDALVFFGSASWAAAHGLRVRPTRAILVVEDSEVEGRPGLDGLKAIFRVPAALVFGTPEQQELVERIAGDMSESGGAGRAAKDGSRVSVPKDVIGPGIEIATDEDALGIPAALRGSAPYLLLAGPLDARDGYAVAVERVLRAAREGRAPLLLVLAGRGRISVGESAYVRQLGDLSEAATRAVVRGALSVLVPSRREALPRPALLAWSLGRPVVAHVPGVVMRGLLARAGGGVACAGDEELSATLEVLAAEPGLADALGARGRDYVAGHHSWPVVLEAWERLLARVAAAGAAPA